MSCASAINAVIVGAVAAAECITALSVAPSRRLPTLTTAAPSKDPKTSSHHHLHMPPHSLCERNHAIAPPPHYLPVIGEQLAPEAAPVARSTHTGLLSRHGILDLSASHRLAVYIR